MKVNKLEKERIAGVDGCPGGWFMLYYDGSQYHDVLSSNVDQLVGAMAGRTSVWIDMPIGLGSADVERTVDQLLRKAIPGKSSSVFTPPCREALNENSYEEANRTNREITGKGLSVQAWNLAPKIRDLDRWIRNNPNKEIHFYESFPELCFKALNGGSAIIAKKTSPTGLEMRLNAIKSTDPNLARLYEKLIQKYSRSKLRRDDILDAMSMLLCNKLSKDQGYQYLMDPVEKDQYSIPIRIVWPHPLDLPI
jgi:predicted RNase H-like nuclease